MNEHPHSWGYAGQVRCRDCGTWMTRDWFYDDRDGRFLCLYCAKKCGLKTGMD